MMRQTIRWKNTAQKAIVFEGEGGKGDEKSGLWIAILIGECLVTIQGVFSSQAKPEFLVPILIIMKLI